MELALTVAIILICVAFEGFFSGSEIGVLSASRAKVVRRVEEGSRSGKILDRFLGSPERLLGTTLVGTNLSVVIGTVVFTSYMYRRLGEGGELYSLLVMSPLVLVFGEILPKTVFQQYSDRLVYIVSYPLQAAEYVFFPLVRLLTALSRLITGAGAAGPQRRSPFVTKHELQMLVLADGGEAEMEAEEREMIHRIFTLGTTTASQVMVPLVDVTGIEDTSAPDEVIRKVAEKGYSRLPVYRDNLSNIVGILNVFDIFTLHPEDRELRKVVREPLYVPEVMNVDDLLQEMQRVGTQMAIVVDEYGGAVGIVTVEDLLEEVVGEIQDEYDREKKLYSQTGERRYIIDARMEIDAINEELHLDIPTGSYETLGGYLVTYLRRIPAQGELLRIGRIRYRVTEADRRSVRQVEVVEVPPGRTGG